MRMSVADHLDRINTSAVTDSLPELERLRQGKNYVPGMGSLMPKLVLVGEAPGRTENLRREPFCGPAGRVLNDWLWGANLTRHLVYITNLVKWWPTSPVLGLKPRLATRQPTDAEKEACLPYLLQELHALKTTHVVLLGRHAGGAFLHKGYERGRWYDTDYPFKACAAYHPATVCYQPSTRQARVDDFSRIVKEA